MVTNYDRTKKQAGQGFEKQVVINANTPYQTCPDQLTAYGGLPALIKTLDLLGFKDAFKKHYVAPKRGCKLGDQGMVTGLLALLFIGFQRLGHFEYIRHDPLLRGWLRPILLFIAETREYLCGSQRRGLT